MNFNTANNTFRQLMGNGLSYRVPAFQRDYSWAEDEWDDLWHDMQALFTDDAESAHYMGYLVLQSTDNKVFDIIDGQQRITTLSVFMLAAIARLMDLAVTGNEQDPQFRRAQQLRNSYIGFLDPVSLVPQSKLALNRHNNRFYQDYLVPLHRLPQRGLNASEHLLRKAFAWFKERIQQRCLEDGEQIARFVDRVVDKLFFTVITVNDELNAFKVFETLNARGVKLSATDLLKNYLFSIVASGEAHEVELKNLEQRWEGIIGLLGSESFPEFLRVFWNSRHKLVRKADLFKTIRREVKDREQAFVLIRDLDRYARVYAALRNPEDPEWSKEERDSLQQLQLFNVRQPLAVLMAVFEHFGECQRKAFSSFLAAITIISFRYNVICNRQSNEQERVYNAIARNIASSELKTIREIVRQLNAIYVNDTEFKTAFAQKILSTKNSRQKKIARYILFKIECRLSKNCHDVENANYTLEHILPENPDNAWDAFSEQQQTVLVHRVGNLTLLDKTANKKLANVAFVEKSPVYLKSGFALTRKLADEFDTWTPEKIQSRQDWMAKQATAIWQISFQA